MRKELEIFENRSDDWLAKQRAYEDKISVWDLDDAKKLKMEHEIKHQAYEAFTKKKFNKPQRTIDQNKKAKNLSVGITIFILIMFLFEFFTIMMGY